MASPDPAKPHLDAWNSQDAAASVHTFAAAGPAAGRDRIARPAGT